MSQDDSNLFRAIRDLGDDARPADLAKSLGMSLSSVLMLIERNESRLRVDGDVYSLTPEAEDLLRNDGDAVSGSDS
jgi:hypothetical protein